MPKPLNKKDIDILEERGYWKASSSLDKVVDRLTKKRAPVEFRFIKQAHYIIFTTAKQSDMAGKFRRDNPEVKRIDGTLLKITHWHHIPNMIAGFDEELRAKTKNLKQPKTAKEYYKIIEIASRLSHKLACIHPFENGNGRSSRLLLNAILLRAGLSEIAVTKPKPGYLRAMRQADDGDFILLEKIIVDGLKRNRERLFKELIRKRAEIATAKHRNKN